MILKYEFDNGEYDEEFNYEVDDNDIEEALTEILLKEVRQPLTRENNKLVLAILKELDITNQNDILENYEQQLLDYFEDNAKTLFNDYVAESRDPYGYRGINRDDIDGV